MAVYYEGQEVIVGVKDEATFKTRIVDAGTFTVIKGDAVEVDPDIKVYEVPGSTGFKSPVFDHTLTSTGGSTPKMTISGPLSILEIDLFAAATFQSVTEAAATPWAKIFMPFAGTQPDFSDCTLGTNAYALTAIKAFPIADTSWALTSCICDKLKISAERGSYAKFEASLVSVEECEFDSDAHADATWERGLLGPGGVDQSADNYGMKLFHDIGTCTLGFLGAAGTAIAIQSFSVEYTQDVSGEEPDGSGGWNNFGITNRGGTGEIVLLKDAVVEAALSNWSENGDISFYVLWGTDGATSGDLELTANGKITEIKFDESGIIGATISFNLAADLVAGAIAATSAAQMITLKVVNVIDRSWPAPA